MKNLKKVLALVLVVAMVMGLAITSNAAFSDGSTIKNTEAVDVVSKIGVINGFTDGTFKGTENVTRGQMAKMVCFVMNSGDDVGDYYSSINAYTDCKTHWAKGYIAYCDKMGVVAGIGGGKFAPDAVVTGTQAAKMMLVALGYDATNQGYTGKTWATAVLKDAKDAGLLDGLSKIDMSANLSRDNAAQMVFNALKATMVEYDNSGSSIVVGGITVNTSASKPTDKTNSDKKYSNIDNTKVDNKYTCELGEEYFEKLIKSSKADDLKNPGHEWKYNGSSIGTYADSADNTIVVEDSDKSLNDILTSSSKLGYSVSDIFEDLTGSDNDHAANAYLNGGDATTANAGLANYKTYKLQKGDIVSTYENDDGDVTDITIVRYQLAKIDSVSTSLSTTEKDNGATARLKLVDLKDANGATYYDSYDASGKRTIKDFDAATYKADAILAVAVNGNNIVDSYVATTVSGTLSSAKVATLAEVGGISNVATAGYVSVSGTKYNFAGSINVAAGVVNSFSFKDSYNVYTTKEGYVIGIDGVTSADLSALYYVTGFFSETTSGSVTYYAQRVAMDGKKDVVKLETGCVTDSDGALYNKNITGTISNVNANGIYTFNDDKDTTIDAKSGDGKLTIVALANDSTASKDFGATVREKALSAAIKTDASSLTITDIGKYYVNSKTTYISVEGIGDDADISTSTGGMKAAASTKTIAVYDKDDTKTAVVVIFYGDSLNTSVTTDKVVYLKEQPTEMVSGDNYSATLYFMEDGTEKTVTIDNNDTAGFYTYGMDGDVYTLDDATALYTKDTTTSMTYDDEEGYVEGASINSVYDNGGTTLMSGQKAGKTVSETAHKFTFSDISAKSLVVIDNRSDVEADDYVSSDITSASELKDALDATSSDGLTEVKSIVADIYFNNGVTFVCVQSLTTGNVNPS